MLVTESMSDALNELYNNQPNHDSILRHTDYTRDRSAQQPEPSNSQCHGNSLYLFQVNLHYSKLVQFIISYYPVGQRYWKRPFFASRLLIH